MKLAELTWPEVDALDRDIVVLIPTGSLEQHGRHLPLFTDSLLATAAAEAIEARLPQQILLTPTLWLGASDHHLAFAGSLSNEQRAYQTAIEQVAESLIPHGFQRFFVLNGHGGNTSLNDLAMRALKHRHRECTFGHSGYFAFIPQAELDQMAGPVKGIRHACEAETSLMMHLHPHLVRTDKLRDDGLEPSPAIRGLTHTFDEITEDGSHGYASFANAELGKRLFESAVEHAVREFGALAKGYVLTSGTPDTP